jgi:hypothetical protein
LNGRLFELATRFGCLASEFVENRDAVNRAIGLDVEGFALLDAR